MVSPDIRTKSVINMSNVKCHLHNIFLIELTGEINVANDVKNYLYVDEKDP